jgi:hypothetical protein
VLSAGAGSGSEGPEIAYYESAGDAEAAAGGGGGGAAKAKGRVLVAGMTIEPEAAPPLSLWSSSTTNTTAYFAITPMGLPGNEGHVRRIVFGCVTPAEKEEWVKVLTSASSGALSAKEDDDPASGACQVSVPLRRKPRRTRVELYEKERAAREEEALRLIEAVVCVRARACVCVCACVCVHTRVKCEPKILSAVARANPPRAWKACCVS